jgi:hypothetical protein
VSSDPDCTVCEGAGWDWKQAANEQQQVDDPVVYYRCPCVEVMRLRAAVERLLSALLPLSIAGAQDDVNELFAAIKETHP